MDRSHRPHTPHPNSHTPEEIKWVRNLVRRTPDISCPELWWKLHRKKGYHRHPGSLRRLLIRLGLRPGKAASTKEKHAPMPYDTPTSLGVKWQMDVKYVPAACYASQDGQKFYQYTMIDEAARKRFIYPYMEQSSASTCDFIRRAILFFKYVPAIIQTDNGSESLTQGRRTVSIPWTPSARSSALSTSSYVQERLATTERWNAATGTTRSAFQSSELLLLQ